MALRADRSASSPADRSRATRLALGAIVALGAIPRAVVVGQDLYADELATYWIVTTRSFLGVIRTVSTTAEISPPVSFLLSWITTRLGSSPELVRLPSLVIGIATIPLVYAVAERTVGRRAGLVAAALTALSPFMIFYSAEARGYGVLMGIVLLSTLALLRAIDHGGRGWWGLYALCVCLATYTHYTAIFVLGTQFVWAFLARPRARRHLVLATTAAAALYLPWLPSLNGDQNSPTTDILGFLSPLTFESVKVSLGHWAVGFPIVGPGRSLGDLPGPVAIALLLLGLGLGLYAAAASGKGARAADDGRAGPLGLVVLLAVATPLGAIGQSVIGTDIVSVRGLAASWPYLAIAVAALVTAGRPRLQVGAATLVVGAMAVGAVTMLGSDFQRPDYGQVVRLADERPGSVIVNARILSPGPLTNFEVEGTQPDARVFRAFKAPQMEEPFTIFDPRPPSSEVMRAAVATADGAPIILLSDIPVPADVEALIALLPDGYRRTRTDVLPGIFVIQALVFERDPAG